MRLLNHTSKHSYADKLGKFDSQPSQLSTKKNSPQPVAEKTSAQRKRGSQKRQGPSEAKGGVRKNRNLAVVAANVVDSRQKPIIKSSAKQKEAKPVEAAVSEFKITFD